MNSEDVLNNPDQEPSLGIDVTYSYPNNPDYEYETYLEKINLEEERIKDISTGQGFVISEFKGIKKDLKDPDSIFSPRFGQTLKHLNPFANRYRCECGFYEGRVRKGDICPICKTPVTFVGDNLNYFGWICLQNHKVISPAYYVLIRFFIGKDFLNILKPERKVDIDGNEKPADKPSDQPYYGIGMTQFMEKFDEIMKYYLDKKKGTKIEYYNDIMEGKDQVFTDSIPVFTTLLRPFDVDNKMFSHEDTNPTINMINKLVTVINQRDAVDKQLAANLPINIKNGKNKSTDDLLNDLQTKMMVLYNKIIDIISGKRGIIRNLLGGRYNFSGRDVIVGNPDLRIDEVTLSYHALVELLSQKIINILQRSYGMEYHDAYDYWWKANINQDPIVVRIIETLIHASGDRGLPIIINRNPTIEYGSILQMYCVGMTYTYTMAVPLAVLPLLAADFDGDVLNILLIINKDFEHRAEAVFNPRNTQYISRNDGLFNNAVNHQKDLLINGTTLFDLGNQYLTVEEKQKIQQVLEMNKNK